MDNEVVLLNENEFSKNDFGCNCIFYFFLGVLIVLLGFIFSFRNLNFVFVLFDF